MRPYFKVVDAAKGKASDASGVYFRFKPNDEIQDGDVISAILVGQDSLIDVFVEQTSGEVEERRQFNSVGPSPESQGKGWTPGVAGTLEDLNPDKPRKDPLMSRIISKAACPNKADLESWLRYETGGYVSMIGEPIDRGLNWEVKVFSPDGKPSTPQYS